MKFLAVLIITVLASVSVCHKLELLLRDIETETSLPWASYYYDYDYVNGSLDPNIVELSIEKVNSQGSKCVDAIQDDEKIPCFAFLDVNDPLNYNLIIDMHHNDNKDDTPMKLSLVRNSAVTGIVPILRAPIKGPEPSVIKLKRTTKTYQDKKANKEATTAQFSVEDESENEDKTWFQKNWKILVIGLIIYNLVTAMNKQEEARREIESKKKPLID